MSKAVGSQKRTKHDRISKRQKTSGPSPIIVHARHDRYRGSTRARGYLLRQAVPTPPRYLMSHGNTFDASGIVLPLILAFAFGRALLWPACLGLSPMPLPRFQGTNRCRLTPIRDHTRTKERHPRTCFFRPKKRCQEELVSNQSMKSPKRFLIADNSSARLR